MLGQLRQCFLVVDQHLVVAHDDIEEQFTFGADIKGVSAIVGNSVASKVSTTTTTTDPAGWWSSQQQQQL